MSAKAVAFVAFLLIGSGLLTGILPVTEQGGQCGSAFKGISLSEDETDSLSYAGELRQMNSCEDMRNLVRIPAIVLIAAGGVTLLAAVGKRWTLTISRF
ncbi:hypothetical protein [Streptosporangium sp. NPDC002524]|uniref:hypothetical protein n=1 Tax=Streptosporangium sp. NPDC002524 TaxID=3154537 RepID=UPI003327DAA0